jgi:putative amidoligase enzyme
LSDRAFGVEIECGYAGGVDGAEQLLRAEGFLARHWSVGRDGSGVEVRTPKLRGKDGFHILRHVMDCLRDNGAYVTRADGMHVHHDAPEFVRDPENVQKLARSWVNNQPTIRKLVAEHRFVSPACPAWTEDNLNRLEENGHLGPRGGLNLRALREHKSIEIRLHEGSLDPDRAIAWVEFGQKFIESVLGRKRPIVCPDDEDILFSRIKATKTTQQVLKTRAPALPPRRW